jgi:competence protein ComEC
MANTIKSPLFRIASAFLLGIVMYIHIGHCEILGQAFYVSLVVLLLVRFSTIGDSWKFRWLPGVLICLSITLGGYKWTSTYSAVADARYHFDDKNEEGASLVIMKVLTMPEIKENSFRLVTKLLTKLDSSLQAVRLDYRCLVYIQKDSLGKYPVRGDIIIVRTVLNGIEPPQNPHEFDFQRYMSGRNVALRAFVKTDEWRLLSHQDFFLLEFATKCQKFILSRLESAGLGDQEMALAASLLLGDKDGLERDLRDSFSAAGAMHVLCVSGLHVGIIYVVLNFFIKGLSRYRYGKIFRSFLVISLIWLYALITGLSPSVTRASLMFSLLQTGKLMRNPPPTINSLAASALILTMINPLVITNLGFQFSYLAVLAIVEVVPLFQSLWQPSFTLISKAWSLGLVSIAAQLGTGPLVLHYFHQFPVWFLLTNLAVIPLATIIIYLALATILIPIPEVYEFCGALLIYSLRLLSGSVRYIENLPGSVISSVHIPALSTTMIYALFFTMYFSIKIFSKKWLMATLVVLIALYGTTVGIKWQTIKQRELYVYKTKGYCIVDLFIAERCYSIYEQELVPESILSYNVEPNRISSKIKSTHIINSSMDSLFIDDGIMYYGGFLNIDGYKAYLFHNSIPPEIKSTIEVDILIIAQHDGIELEDVLTRILCEEAIIGCSVPPWKLEEYENVCRKLGIRCWPVYRQGYWVKKLN